MLLSSSNFQQDGFRNALRAAYRKDEAECLSELLKAAKMPPEALKRIQSRSTELVLATRVNRQKVGGLDSFLRQYDLSSEEGIALMCMAEALLRIPDKNTIDRLISDKISTANWHQHLNLKKGSLFVNAATWSLLLTGKLYAPTLSREKSLTTSLKQLFSRASGAVIRPIIMQGMKIIGKQFVMGTTIEEALKRAAELESQGYLYSYDMLGEAARTHTDAEHYYQAYVAAIAAIGKHSFQQTPFDGPGISIKLSALHPRYEMAHRETVFAELAPKLLALAKQAKAYNIGLTVDAEEADRLELSLDLFEMVFNDPDLAGWQGFGLAVQAYQKRALAVINWLIAISKNKRRRIMVRLIKGAYWDAEIKNSQLQGFSGYPVFTRKNATDVSYLACAKLLLANTDCFYPQFGTHNAYSVAAILELAGTYKDFEFQCLHGMGQPLYHNIVGKDKFNIPCRIYAPVGSHKDLLGYLVRRLLENGANTSFINQSADESIRIEDLITDPVMRIAGLASKPHPYIPLPKDIFAPARKNARGIDLSNPTEILELQNAMQKWETKTLQAGPIVNGKILKHTEIAIVSPSNTSDLVGLSSDAKTQDIEDAMLSAQSHWQNWAATPVSERAAILDNIADHLENDMPKMIAILCREAGKQIVDCIGEVREAIDFCRYYAQRARADLIPTVLAGPTGEFNQLSLHGRGIIICISPWNFPLAIFLGQIAAALVAGNAVIAKPAEQTPLIAAEAIQLMHAAGIPKQVLHLLPGDGELVGSKLVGDERIAGVMFTGSTAVAKSISQILANREGPIIPFIAETGGQNALIVDSSALPEQVVVDVMQSAFNSAGQRCSALRVLFLQEDIADRVLNMLKGAMKCLKMGDPSLLSTDVGPVIDQEALSQLQAHILKMEKKGRKVFSMPLEDLPPGHYCAPHVFEIADLSILTREVFGPILHVIRFPSDGLDKVLDSIKKTEFGLTLGIHSRINATVAHIVSQMPVGNIYVNRNIIGAVVGVQPFGGEGMSGTGPKAGGPHYLTRLSVERAISINTTAAGGNATLVSLNEDD